MKSQLLALTVVAATLVTVALYPTVEGRMPQPARVDPIPVLPTTPNQRPKIEVVFALDTTGSMGGLIQGAKENIWSIASAMASAEGNPEIKMGLVAYRDRGDAYVTRVTDLSTDLDAIYATLMDFDADGGGDGPESVNQALYDAVHNVSWSQDPDAYKVVFLVGDAPGHVDYQDDVPFPISLSAAKDRGIIVNTIQCGGSPGTKAQWSQIAQLGLGNYMQVAQSGGALAVTTPYDEQLAALARQLDDSRLFFGDKLAKAKARARQVAADKVHAEASVASRAKRGLFNVSESGARNFSGENELVDAVTSGRVDLDELAEEELPTSVQAMSPAARDGFVASKAEERKQIKAQMKALQAQRKDFVDRKLGELGNEEASLDFQVYDTVRLQAGKKGLIYKDKPDY